MANWVNMVRLERNRWHHAALTWDGSGNVALYLDGECYGRRRMTEGNRLDVRRLTGPLCLGMPRNPVGYLGVESHPSRLDGTLADFRLYRQALDDGAIAAIVVAGQTKLDASFTAPPQRLATLLPGTPEVIAERQNFCWFPNNIARMPDGHFETAAHFGPDYAPVLTDYWKTEGQGTIFYHKANADAPWVLGKGHVLRTPVQLADGRWLVLGSTRETIISTDGQSWEKIDFTLLNAPSNAIVGTALQAIDQWYVDSTGRLLALGILSFTAKTDKEESWTERLFGGAGGKKRHLFLATPAGDDITQLNIFSIITEGQEPPFGALNEEIHLVESAPGEFLLVGRVAGHNLPCIQMRSTDNGYTWSKIELCPFGAVWPRLEKMNNGIVCCHVGRPDTVIHWTADGGRTWSPPVQMLDSREIPLQSMNLFYGASTGYGSMVAAGPDRLFEMHDVLGTYNPETMARTNQCLFTDIRVRTIDDYADQVIARADCGQFAFTGDWQSDVTLGDAGVSVWTRDAQAGATLTFAGTGIVLLHPLLRHGGKLLATIDGQPMKPIDLYDALPHHRFGRTVVATDLPAGRHTLTLTPDLSGSARHAHGDGTALAGINRWFYLRHTTARRWCAFCAAELLG